MEEHRLKNMQLGYDVELFNQLYLDTYKLRRKLARSIDCNRFKVSYEDVVSWFDIKFIFVFNKYYGKMDNNILKGHIISSLSLYPNRIMRMAYSPKFNRQNIINFEDREAFEPLVGDDRKEEALFKEAALSYLKRNLPEEAYLVLQVELYPPYYIIQKLTEQNKNIQKIPAHLIGEYLGWENTSKINRIRKLISKATEDARAYFKDNPILNLLED